MPLDDTLGGTTSAVLSNRAGVLVCQPVHGLRTAFCMSVSVQMAGAADLPCALRILGDAGWQPCSHSMQSDAALLSHRVGRGRLAHRPMAKRLAASERLHGPALRLACHARRHGGVTAFPLST